MKTKIIVYTAAILLFCMNILCSASTVYTNATSGPPSTNRAFTYQYVANDFSLSDSYTLTGLTFNAWSPQEFHDISQVSVKFYINDRGIVGDEISSLTTSIAGTSFTGMQQNYYQNEFYTYDYTVVLPHYTFAAGDYWMALHIDTREDYIYWSQGTWDTPGADPVVSRTGETGTYRTHYPSEYEFSIQGDLAPVPMPAAFTLLGSGLLGLAGVGRKNRQ